MDLFLPDRPEIFSAPTQGKVEQTITQNHPGRVECFGTCWAAQLYPTDCITALFPGQLVNVIGRKGITLLVVPNNYCMDELEGLIEPISICDRQDISC
jgi:membrane-bound ClpP family serine protease